MCLQEEPSVRPLIGDVVAAITSLEVAPPDELIPESLSPEKVSSDREISDDYEPKSSDNEDRSSEQNDEKVHYNTDNQKVAAESDEDDRASSDYGYGSTSGSSENEKDDSTYKHEGMTTKSGKWGSKSRRKSKLKSSSRTISSSSRRKSKVLRDATKDPQTNDSFNLRDDKIHFSLRQQSSVKSKDVSFGAYSSHSSNEESESESNGLNHQHHVQLKHETMPQKLKS